MPPPFGTDATCRPLLLTSPLRQQPTPRMPFGFPPPSDLGTHFSLFPPSALAEGCSDTRTPA